MEKKKHLCSALLVCIFIYSGCAQKKAYAPQKAFKSDSDYYIALRKLDEGNRVAAARLFAKAAKNASPYCARASMEELTRLGNVQERQKACMNLVAAYNDDNARLTAARELFEEEEYARLISVTQNLDYAECPNHLALLRLESLRKKNDSRCYKEAFQWFSRFRLSSDHYKFFQNIKSDYLKAAALPDKENSPLLQDEGFLRLFRLADFRIDVFRRNYAPAYEKSEGLKDTLVSDRAFLSDMGKAALYGSKSFAKNARRFDSLADELESKSLQFFAYFYAGRLYERGGDYISLAAKRYKSAMASAENGADYDNALWYLLNLELSRSVQNALDAVKEYCSTWHEPEYFDDFFETLSPLLLSQGKWQAFRELYTRLDGFASDSMTAKFAYIYGRLVEEKIASPAQGNAKDEAHEAFLRALKSGNGSYYKVMAINALKLDAEDAERALLDARTKFSQSERDEGAERFLLGFAAFGLPQKIYPEWQKMNAGGAQIGFDAAVKLAAFLRDCGHKQNEYYTQSLRMAAKAFSAADKPFSRSDLETLYPRGYANFVSAACKKHSVPEEILYALIRSESFFDAEVKSSAGAVGLTQLMEMTASDVARKLRRQTYSLKNAEDNIEFGAFYLSELTARLEGKRLYAFFSYNAGMQRVRRWLKASAIEFGRNAPVSADIFLETIPFAETREYGRKLISSAALYGFLYYGASVPDTVSSITD
ncbi:MAG: flagellar assembly lytic transglycosylase [Treponema sp.]